MIQLKRVYEPPEKNDGLRILVERLWPRGIKKEKAKIDVWSKDSAPSTELRKWYKHDVAKWVEFCRKYREELKGKENEVKELEKRAALKKVTFVYAARDEEHNSAVVLKKYILERTDKRRA